MPANEAKVISNTTAPSLALGTVQLGLPYGLTCGERSLERRDVADILAMAWEHGIDMLDTAADYGTAEQVIGEVRPAGARFAIVSKTPRIGGNRITSSDIAKVQACLRQSLTLLGTGTLYGVLIHHAQDLLVPGGRALFEALDYHRRTGSVSKIGVSVYDPDMLSRVLDDYPVEIVQLPVNLLDQRFVRDGTVTELARRGVEVHARSVFLQGVLLTDPERLPLRFAKIRATLDRLRHDVAAGASSPAAIALGFVARCQGVARIIIGVDSVSNLRENIAAFEEALAGRPFDPMPYAIDDPDIIDPRRWLRRRLSAGGREAAQESP